MASEKILIVDAALETREALAALLRRDNYTVESVSGGDDALRLMAYKSYDLVVAELALDESSPPDVLQRMHDRDGQLPMIVVTENRDASRAMSAIHNGAMDVVLKPYEPLLMLGAVARAVSRGIRNREAEVYKDGLEAAMKHRTRQLQTAMSELERSYDTTLEALGDALDLKDSETEGHSRRVTAYTIALATCMGVPPVELKTIKHGAYLHDIGKMAVPDRILLKPGKLDSDEVDTMQRHCEAGYQIVRKIPFLREAAEIVHSHQEYFNGHGYPQGLKGEEIPLGARIFAVADALDAITSDRPYRKGRPYTIARDEIARCAGTQFDPRVVEAFLSVPEQVWEELRGSIETV